MASDLATNAIQHSRSGQPVQTFTVRAILCPSDCARVEVIDLGAEWTQDESDDETGAA